MWRFTAGVDRAYNVRHPARMERDPTRKEIRLQERPAPATTPQAVEYQRKLAARRAGTPVGGVPLPNMPRFDQDPPMHPQGASIPLPQAPGPAPGLYHTDLLTDEAKKDQRYVQGHGSELAANQPHLAFQYGVMRNGRYVPPSELIPNDGNLQQAQGVVGQRGPLRQQTVQDIEALQKLQSKKEEAEEEEESKSRISTDRLAGKPEEPISEEEAKKALSNIDDLDFYNFTQAMMRDLINNEDQRKIIEDRLEEIDLTDLIMTDRFRQKVPIVPDKFEPVFEIISGINDLAMKRLIAEEARALDVNEKYLLDKFAMMQLAAGVAAIGSVQMPDYRDQTGVLDADLYWKRFNRIAKLPTPVLASLGANYYWFDSRCRRACTAKNLKNG